VASYEAVLKPIEGTILTVVRETADAAVVAASRGENLVNMLRVARSAGREALANTPELLPVLKDAGVVDAGGAGFMLFIDSALHVVAGDALPEPEDVSGPSAEQLEAVSLRAGADGAVDVSELRYEVIFRFAASRVHDGVGRNWRQHCGGRWRRFVQLPHSYQRHWCSN
jgi:dihydroxyacetone kinase-like predicted kinase